MEYSDFMELAKTSISNCIHVGNGTFEEYKLYVDLFIKERPIVVKQYGLTESELFVMFMMIFKNYDEIQQQFFLLGKMSPFSKECMYQYDSFLRKAPVSTNLTHYRLERYYKIGDFEKIMKMGKIFVCHHYLTASSSRTIFEKWGDGVKIYINRPIIDKNSKAREVYKIYNDTKENQVNYERNTYFQINRVDKQNRVVELTEL